MRLAVRYDLDTGAQPRYEDIRAVERHLARNGTAIRRFFHQVSTGDQRRFLARINTPDRLWPLDLADLRTRDGWDSYMRAYEQGIHETAADAEPGRLRVVTSDAALARRVRARGAAVAGARELLEVL